MKKVILMLVGGLLGIVLIFAGVVQLNFEKQKDKTYSAVDFSIKELVGKADVQLGKRLYAVRNGCIDCHGSDLSGVMVMDDPAMGSIYGANITSTYLSDWSDEEVARAIRYGIHKNGRSLKFMPSFDFANLSLEDTAALVAYVKSVSPVEKPSHENTFGPIAKVLTLFNQMPVMFPAKVVDLNRVLVKSQLRRQRENLVNI